jgi:hypothetical protein
LKVAILGNKADHSRDLDHKGGARKDQGRYNDSLLAQFTEVEALERRFFEEIFDNIENTIDLGRNDQMRLKGAMKVIEEADKSSLLQKGAKTFWERSEEMREKMVLKRFEQQIGSAARDNNIDELLNNIKFSLDDLLEIWDTHQKIFPEKPEIFKTYTRLYKLKIEEYIVPALDAKNLDENEGVWLNLVSWSEGYEYLLSNSGIEGFNLDQIKQKIGKYENQFMKRNKDKIEELVGSVFDRD